MLRRLTVTAGAAAVVAATCLPASAAGSTTLYFDNHGASGKSSCTPKYVLTRHQPTGLPCAEARVGFAGSGFLDSDTFTNDAGAKGFRLDAKRRITGIVYITSYSPVIAGVGSTTVSSVPGYVGATVTLTVNGVRVGRASGAGPVTSPNGAYGIPLSMKVPSRLNGQAVKAVSVVVKYNDGQGVTGAAYSGSTKSRLVLPTR